MRFDTGDDFVSSLGDVGELARRKESVSLVGEWSSIGEESSGVASGGRCVETDGVLFVRDLTSEVSTASSKVSWRKSIQVSTGWPLSCEARGAKGRASHDGWQSKKGTSYVLLIRGLCRVPPLHCGGDRSFVVGVEPVRL